MNKFERSWLLLKNSLSIIGRNKQLLVFPLVTFICTAAIVLFFLGPPILRPTGNPYTSAEHWKTISHSLFTETGDGGRAHFSLTRGAMVYAGFLYFIAMFIGTFFNVAFYHEILAALTGQPVSLGRGLKFAFSKLGSIFMWTLFAGLVGLIIKLIEEGSIDTRPWITHRSRFDELIGNFPSYTKPETGVIKAVVEVE